MATLTRVPKPPGKLTPDTEQGEEITTKDGWRVAGFRDANDTYYERGRRGTEERWFRLD